METRNSKLENRNSSIGGDAGDVAPHFLGGFGLRNETGMSFRISGDINIAFFVPFFSGTKLECPLESANARGTNPNTNPKNDPFSRDLASILRFPETAAHLATCEGETGRSAMERTTACMGKRKKILRAHPFQFSSFQFPIRGVDSL
jgi:hypothetical protein